MWSLGANLALRSPPRTTNAFEFKSIRLEAYISNAAHQAVIWSFCLIGVYKSIYYLQTMRMNWINIAMAYDLNGERSLDMELRVVEIRTPRSSFALSCFTPGSVPTENE